MSELLNRRPTNGFVLSVFAVAVAVSVVHYLDNTFNYGDYPSSDSVPQPSQGLVAFGWFFFTAFGIAAVLRLREGTDRAAAICLAVYSGSGLVGVGHYTVPGAVDMPWWRQAHIAADITCGIVLFVTALRLARATRPAAVSV